MRLIASWPDPDFEALPVGGKARALAALSRAGFAVPHWRVVLPAAWENAAALMELLSPFLNESPGPWAVRSSASDEDGQSHSFAGQLESFLAGGFFWILLVQIFGRDFLLPYLLCMAAHTGNIITARLRVVRSHLPIGRILLIGWLVPSILFSLLAVIGAALQLLPVIGIIWVPVAIFVPAWPLRDGRDQRARIWLSETGIAVAASLLGLIR